jgi:putative acetyltransferase
MRIRIEKPEDVSAVYQININVFSTDAEANLVDMLREENVPLISLVAEDKKRLVGHILFTPVNLKSRKGPRPAIAGLGPMAVLADCQRQGVGLKLVEEGLKQCIEAGYDAVVVLGSSDYYSRFGFVPSVKFGITSNYDVPEDLFMALELKEGSLKGVKGIVSYHDLFIDV